LIDKAVKKSFVVHEKKSLFAKNHNSIVGVVGCFKNPIKFKNFCFCQFTSTWETSQPTPSLSLSPSPEQALPELGKSKSRKFHAAIPTGYLLRIYVTHL
jgi:hypothetical protein